MEDGIESHKSILVESDKGVHKTTNNKSSLYIYIPDNIFSNYEFNSVIDHILSNVIIVDKKDIIDDLIKKRNGRYIVFDTLYIEDAKTNDPIWIHSSSGNETRK